MKLPLILVISLIVVAIFSLGNPTQAESSAVGGEVYAALDSVPEHQEEKVRVYITLEERSIMRRSVHTSQADVRSIIGDDAVKHTFENTLSAFVTRDELEQLEHTEGVSRVSLVGTRQIMLQSSRALVNATHAAPLHVNGINLTGFGQTICVIDTGVNYSHESLGGCYGNASASSTCKVWGGWDYCANNADCSTSDEVPDDVYGHGTHVAGIAAANGSIQGVAPDARIVMIKACNASGNCFDDDIQAGINWCIGNRTTLNISVISMSLGSGTNSNYCNDDPLAPQINSAVGSNITVVIATGNGGSTTGISAPACVQNATAIGSIRKNDATFDYNRNNLTLLVAPGFSINSTAVGGGYALQSGTSMATPHAAGAVAILTQYLNMTNRVRTPAQIISTLNSTGRRINDAGSNWNYSRIDIYSAVISLDTTAPNVTLVGPANATSSLNVNQTFNCNATDLSLRNVTLFVWNSSSSIVNQSVRTISGNNNAAEFNATNLTRGTHQWNCLFADENNNSAFTASNRTITVSDVTTTLAAPGNTLITNVNQTLSCNATTTATLANSTLYVWNSSTALLNTTVLNASGSANTTNFSYNFLNEDVHTWNCLFTTTSNLQQFASANFTITYDVTNPRVNLTEPGNKSRQNAGYFNATLNENGTCSYTFTGGVINYTMSSANQRFYNATNTTLAHGSNHTASYYCNDSAGNRNNTLSQSFYVDLLVPNVTLLNPNVSYNLTASSTSITFNYTVIDESNISACRFILNGAVNTTNSTVSNNSANHSFAITLAAGTFTWLVNCTDEAGGTGNSSSRSVILTEPASASGGSSGGSGGGGGGAATSTTGTTYRPTMSDVQKGFTRQLKPSDSIKVAIPISVPTSSGVGSSGSSSGNTSTVEHTVTVDNVTNTSAQITVRSEPIKLTLNIGQEVRLNLTSSAYYDLYIKLENIVNTSANITVRVIAEPMLAINASSLSSGASSNTSRAADNASLTNAPLDISKTGAGKAWLKYGLIILIVCIIIAIAVYLFWYWSGQKDKPWEPSAIVKSDV